MNSLDALEKLSEKLKSSDKETQELIEIIENDLYLLDLIWQKGRVKEDYVGIRFECAFIVEDYTEKSFFENKMNEEN